MEEGKKEIDHGRRLAREAALSGGDEALQAAEAAASWKPVPKSPEAFQINPPNLKENPPLKTEEERISTVREALSVATKYMHQAEGGKVPQVGGMKTYGLAIVVETLGYTPEQIVKDEGALSDLYEYLIAMVRVAKGLDIRDPKFDPKKVDNPDVELISRLGQSWDLPNNEFGQPFVYSRVDWQKRSLSKGN